MTISPLLKSRLEKSGSQNYEYEKAYENLKTHANDVHPNAPKAKLVNETLGQGIKSYFKDTKQDFANFNKTVKTGKMSDNNIGRLNDVGMKIGGLIIASFLALHSKSKQESIMKFVGTGAFFASMKLWPKMFINLPAKIVHGVDPGKKYVTAQGDKKEFYLDNQFLPWDITDIEDEKERRRHQKVALQNRTLWMATVGAAVPLMTALVSNRLEPVVERGISLYETAKVNGIAGLKDGIKNYLNPKNVAVQNESEIAKLCEQYASNPLDPEFAGELEKYLRINNFNFKDPDWAKTIKSFSPNSLNGAIKETWKEYAEHAFSLEDFQKFMLQLKQEAPSNLVDALSEDGELPEKVGGELVNFFSDENIKAISEKLFGSNTQKVVKFKDIEKAIDEVGIGVPSSNERIQNWLKGADWNNESFFAAIKDYNKNFVSEVRGRISRYLKLANPIVGETADSVYTHAYSKTMKNLFNRLGYSIDSSDSFVYKISDFVKVNVLHQNPNVVNATKHVSLRDIANKDEKTCLESLVNYFQALVKDVEYGSSEYESIIRDLTKTHLSDAELKASQAILNKENIDLIAQGGIPTLNKAVLGDSNGSITNVLSQYVSQQKTNVDALVSRLAICANFETRLKQGLIKIGDTDIRELSDGNFLEIARKIVYNGGPNTMMNRAGAIDKSQFHQVLDAIYSNEAFQTEPSLVRENVKKVYGYAKKSLKPDPKDEYLANSDLLSLVKNQAKKVYPSKVWLKKAGIAGIAIVAVTLLAQPLFGKIKKEFPKEDKKQEKKGGVN